MEYNRSPWSRDVVGEKNPMFGRTHSPSAKQKISEARRRMKGKYHHSEETREKMRLSAIGKNKGRKHTPEELLKRSKTCIRGKNHYNWKGGISGDRNQYAAIQQHKYRAQKRGNGGSFIPQEWDDLKKKYGYRCPMCGMAEPTIKLTADHIIPISMGGSSYINNIQPLCKKCNSSKYEKTFSINPVGQFVFVYNPVS